MSTRYIPRDFLSLFEGDPSPPSTTPTSATPSSPPSAGPTLLNLNDPTVAALIREEAAKQARDEFERMQAEAAERARIEAEEAAERARLEALSGTERLMAELAAERQAREAQNQAMKMLVDETNRRILAHHVEAERTRIVAHYNGELDPSCLDLSSVEALHASVPRAIEAYQAQKQFFFEQFQAEMQRSQALTGQTLIESLAPYPSNPGLPSPNNAGTPAPAEAQPGAAQFVHPQIDGGRSYAAVRERMMHGRVYEPMTTGPVYPPQATTYTHVPHGLPTPQMPPPQANFHPPTPMPVASAPSPVHSAPAPVPGLTSADHAAAVEAARVAAMNARSNPASVAAFLKGEPAVVGATGGGAAGPTPTQPPVGPGQLHPMIRQIA